MLNSINIVIADLFVKLYSESQILTEEGYQEFLKNDDPEEFDVTINCFQGMPDFDFENLEMVFEAKNEIQKFYRIFKKDTDLLFIIYNQQYIDEIQQIAVLDKTYANWNVYSLPNSETSLWPLKYPLGPIVMHYLAIKSNAVMIHASCIFDGKKGRIFTGFSGNGKSTISKLWADSGNLLINDDRLIIRNVGNRFYVFNTPMYYSDKSKKTVLDAIYLISHSTENKINKVSGALAVSKVLAFCIQNNFDKKFIQQNLNFMSELCSQIPVYELGFVPDEAVIKFILRNEI